MDSLNNNTVLCQKEGFVHEANKQGYLVDAAPQLAAAQAKVTGRCGTRDTNTFSAQHSYWEWGKDEASWFFYDHRTKECLLLTTSKPLRAADNRN